ncbi:MAG: RecB-family nuclease [Desulfurococcales archaeon]|nr:RecB-family nuclease [Desulfurococcales archaeon]
MAEIIPVLHNVSSVQRLVDLARASYQLGFKALAVSKVYGGAAQSGVPEAFKLALKYGSSLLVLPDLDDVVDALSPDRVLIITPREPETIIDPVSPPRLDGKVLIVFNGGETGFSPSEEKLGARTYIAGVDSRLGAVAEAGIILYTLSRRATHH